MEEITATELKQRLDNGDDIQIIDVREDNEVAIASYTGFSSHPAGGGAKSHGRDRSEPRNGRSLQDGRAQRTRDRGTAALGIQGQTHKLERRDSRLVE